MPKYEFVEYAGRGYAKLRCPKGHVFKWRLRVTEPPLCPVCEGIVKDNK